MRTSLFIAMIGAGCLTAIASMAGAAEFTVAPTTIDELKAVFGEVESRHSLPVRTRIGGTIASISVVEGSEVDKGEAIATVVDDKIALQIQAADAEAQALESQLANAMTDLERAEKLLASGSTTKSRVDQASTQVDVLNNQLDAAAASRAVLAQQEAEGQVLAPESGRILAVPVTLGSVVLPGETIATVAAGGYFLRLSLPERHATEIAEGGTVLVGQRVLSATGVPDSAQAREGRLVKVYPEISNGRVLADVEVDGLGDYFIGERTVVWVPVGRRQVLSVPPDAVTTRHGIDYVQVAAEDGPVDVAVVVGGSFKQGDDERIEVLTGLMAGDRVILP